MIQIGPFSISLERFYVLIAFVVFIIIAELLDKTKKTKLSNWANNSMLITLLFSRLGFVIENMAAFAKEPLSIIKFWEGGFSPLWGIAAAIFYSVWYFRKNRDFAKWALLPSLTALVLWSGLGYINANQNKQDLAMPDLQLYDLSENKIDLIGFKGKPTVINMWATWCAPCRRELPMLANLAREHENVNFVFVDQAESAEKVEGYLGDNGIRLEHILLDSTGQLANYFHSRGLPTTLFFNSQGKLVSSVYGQISKVVLENKLKQLN